MIKAEDVYRIGRLGKAHGIKGEITMQVEDDIFDRTDAEYLVLELDNIMVPFFIEEYYFKTDTTALIKFEGIDTIERAKEFANVDVYFPRNIQEVNGQPPHTPPKGEITPPWEGTGEVQRSTVNGQRSTVNGQPPHTPPKGEITPPWEGTGEVQWSMVNGHNYPEEALSYPMLVGFQVNDIGKIAYIDHQTENVMFELEDGTLIPASEELIEDIDVANKQIKMTIPEGLLDI